MVNEKAAQITSEGRLLSLDFFRGLTMFLLIGEFTGLFSNLTDPAFEGTLIHAIGTQLHHHPWNGLRFWDLVQPFFMFIVGVALPFSVSKRAERGDSRNEVVKHAIQRSILLLLLGWALYCIVPGEITFRFQNVLAQLSVAYIVAFLLMRKSTLFQLAFSFVLILATEALYRSFPVAGFNHPFVPNENFGTWFDLLYNGADLHDHWVSFNAVPTTAHTIWGVLAGYVLMSSKAASEKLKILLIAGLTGVVVGYALDPLTPIIKRISTSSFVIASGGWSILALAVSYWLIDIKRWRKWVTVFAVVGMNPLFIYLFAHVDGAVFLNHIVAPFTHGLVGWSGELATAMVTNSVVWLLLWYICYWMYKKRIFIKI